MMRLIDADVLRNKVRQEMDRRGEYFPIDFIDVINEAPEVDAVKVVRCKNCKHSKAREDYFFCDYHAASVLSSWYCWHGESTAEPKRGRWQFVEDATAGEWWDKCSNCGWMQMQDLAWLGSEPPYKYCPNCGVEMEKENTNE